MDEIVRSLHDSAAVKLEMAKIQVDVALVVPSSSTQHIQEAHITVGHILCEALESRILETASEDATSRPL